MGKIAACLHVNGNDQWKRKKIMRQESEENCWRGGLSRSADPLRAWDWAAQVQGTWRADRAVRAWPCLASPSLRSVLASLRQALCKDPSHDQTPKPHLSSTQSGKQCLFSESPSPIPELRRWPGPGGLPIPVRSLWPEGMPCQHSGGCLRRDSNAHSFSQVVFLCFVLFFWQKELATLVKMQLLSGSQ